MLFANMAPGQREALLIGVPVVLGFVLIKKVTTPKTAAAVDPNSAAAAAAVAAGNAASYQAATMPAGSTGVIGTGDLSTYFSGITTSIADLTTNINDLINKGNTTPPPVTGGVPKEDPIGWEHVQAGDTLSMIANRLRVRGIVTRTFNGVSHDLTPDYLLFVNPRFAHIGVNGPLPAGEAVKY